jgi:predicted nucleotidyltransferase
MEERMTITANNRETLQQYFSRKPVEKAFIFGSYARGSADEGSDVDILLELDYSKPIGLEFVQMQIDLEKLLNKKVDLVTSRGLSKRILPIIEKEKQLIYAR